MSLVKPTPRTVQPAPFPQGSEGVTTALLRQGLLHPEDLLHVLSQHRGAQAPPVARLFELLPPKTAPIPALLQAAARHFGVESVDPTAPLPDPTLIDALSATDCLRHSLVPWRRAGGITLIATSRPEEFPRLRPWLEGKLGPVGMVLAPANGIEAAILARRGPRLALAAENRVAEAESARGWKGNAAVTPLILLGIFTLLWPMATLFLFLALALTCLTLATALKLAAALASHIPPPAEPEPPPLLRLPPVSLIVALYRESSIAPRLIRRLSRLDYPYDFLDVLLAVEAEDKVTRDALAAVTLPPWMRVVVVPPGRVKTKPRALNHALAQCRGSIIGIYDAEDAPEPDQIRKIVERFQARGPEVACLQGVLDYYNPRTNWLSRCFTLEYATWFRLVLPGIARLGLAVPLGGTTLFFRRQVLEELGAWDAHNVTEDADLGIRLARHGYRTEMVHTTTYEEANCRALPWVKQRSRWVKGYMMTWAVHMRRPRQLWHQLGARQFIGFQVMFLGSILQGLLAPLLWSFWLTAFGFWHPIAEALPPPAFTAMIALFLLSEVTAITLGLLALKRSGHRLSPLWVPTLHVYFMLNAAAAYKALWEMLTRPFYWDKTGHGIFDTLDPKS